MFVFWKIAMGKEFRLKKNISKDKLSFLNEAIECGNIANNIKSDSTQMTMIIPADLAIGYTFIWDLENAKKYLMIMEKTISMHGLQGKSTIFLYARSIVFLLNLKIFIEYLEDKENSSNIDYIIETMNYLTGLSELVLELEKLLHIISHDEDKTIILSLVIQIKEEIDQANALTKPLLIGHYTSEPFYKNT